jgi:hypothetical protein
MTPFSAKSGSPIPRRLPHDSEDGLRSPAVALDNTLGLGAPGRRHAEAIYNDVGDLISAIEGAQAPIYFDRLSRRVASPRPSAGPADDLADNDRPSGSGRLPVTRAANLN